MAIRGISHIGIGVSDLDRSIDFYRDVVGMRLVHLKTYQEEPAHLARPAETERRTAYLGWNDQADPCLVLSVHAGPSTTNPPRLDENGVHHFALWVDAIAPVLERLQDAGATITMMPTKPEQARGSVTTMFFEDPDGTLVQLDEIPA